MSVSGVETNLIVNKNVKHDPKRFYNELILVTCERICWQLRTFQYSVASANLKCHRIENRFTTMCLVHATLNLQPYLQIPFMWFLMITVPMYGLVYGLNSVVRA